MRYVSRLPYAVSRTPYAIFVIFGPVFAVRTPNRVAALIQSFYSTHPMHFRFTLFTLLILLAQTAFAQISEGGSPPSQNPEWSAAFSSRQLPKQVLAAPNRAALQAEDDQMDVQARFAAPVAADISPANAGAWTTLPDSSRVWRCAVQSPGALALVLLFDQFQLPQGARFFAYSANGQRTLGAYTAQSCISSGRFTIGTLPGDEVILEYHLPVGVADLGQIHLNRVDYAYHRGALSEGDPWAADDFGSALACHVNINCTQAANWQTEKKGVARILMVFSNGSAWCSGSLIANTSGSGDPYFLTAHHCQILLSAPQFDQWTFHFDYEAPTCTNPGSEPTYKSILGCQRIAYRAETDFMLLKINPIPSSYGVYFNGWSRAATAPTTSAFIHHPQGDIKKFSADNEAAVSHPQSINWGAGFGTSQPNTHWKVVPDVGIYEPGSSGCPMFDQNKRIAGQLHGGVATGCNVTAAYFGMFHLSWDQGTTPTGRLKDWLDPANSNATTQNGYVQPPTPISLAGTVQAWWGGAMPNLRVALSGGKTDTVSTDANGNFVFNNLTAGQSFVVKPLPYDDPSNGVTTYDLVLLNRHILNLEPLDSPWKILSGDLNGSNTLTTFDIAEGRKVVLGIYTELPASDSWRFLPASMVFQNASNPWSPALPLPTLTYNNLQQSANTANFYGWKVGDLNQGAVPGQ